MKIMVSPILFIAIAVPIAVVANDYDQVRNAQIPRGQDLALFHYDKMMGALYDGNVRLANAHARARIPHMTLTYRSASFSNYRDSKNPTIQLPSPDEPDTPAIRKPDSPSILKTEIGPINIEFDRDPTKEIDRMVKEGAEMLENHLRKNRFTPRNQPNLDSGADGSLLARVARLLDRQVDDYVNNIIASLG